MRPHVLPKPGCMILDGALDDIIAIPWAWSCETAGRGASSNTMLSSSRFSSGSDGSSVRSIRSVYELHIVVNGSKLVKKIADAVHRSYLLVAQSIHTRVYTRNTQSCNKEQKRGWLYTHAITKPPPRVVHSPQCHGLDYICMLYSWKIFPTQLSLHYKNI